MFTHQNILGYKDSEPDGLQVEELEHMPTANRRRWMRDYMKEYRQGKLRGNDAGPSAQPARREGLKTAHRLHSFKWRLSKLLSPQYEILVCAQYAPEYGAFMDDMERIAEYPEEFYNNRKEVLNWFPILKEFKDAFEDGGEQIFKAFLFRKYNRKFDRAIDCVVGVLDKAALFENLQQLPNQGSKKWEIVSNKVKAEARKGEWRKLDFSRESSLWVDETYMLCQPLKWTERARPRWNSPALHSRLCGWAMGVRRLGPGRRYEWPKANDSYARKLILSPVLWNDEIWCDEIVSMMKSLV